MHIHRSSMKTGRCSCFLLYFLSKGNLGKKKWVKREVLVIHWVFALFWWISTYLFDSCLLKLCFSPQWSHLTRWNSGINKLVILKKSTSTFPEHQNHISTLSNFMLPPKDVGVFISVDRCALCIIKITKEKYPVA